MNSRLRMSIFGILRVFSLLTSIACSVGKENSTNLLKAEKTDTIDKENSTNDAGITDFRALNSKINQIDVKLTKYATRVTEMEKRTRDEIESIRSRSFDNLQEERDRNSANVERLVSDIVRLNTTVKGLVRESQDGTREWLKQTNKETGRKFHLATHAAWNYKTNITDHNAKKKSEAYLKFSAFAVKTKKEARRRQRAYYDCDTARQLTLYEMFSVAPANQSLLKRSVEIGNELAKIYSTALVCRRNETKCVGLNTGLLGVMSQSNDLADLTWAWQGWRDVTGRPARNLYAEWVSLKNVAARDNGFSDMGEYWRRKHFERGIDKTAEKLYREVQPLYKLLFAYVRRELLKKYGDASGIDPRGPIPAHLLGNMWAQDWRNIMNKGIAHPYPDVPSTDVTAELIRQNYTVEGMFRLAEDFFVSIGLYRMTDRFWNKSMFVKPEGRNVTCHASAYNFHTRGDFRIKMCTKISHDSLFVVHHEMGHIEYYMAYSALPHIYRDGANKAFHEAIGDLIALSVNNVAHLKTIGLMRESKLTPVQRYQQNINFLMQQALKIVGFLPFGYLVDNWRWKVFEGKISPENYNRKWWEMRLRYQGVVPPVKRSERDFDPAAKYHVTFGVPYLRYFISHVIQFQFYESMCHDVHDGPLHECDFYGSKSAGEKLKRTLQMGKSKPWPDAMQTMTGQREINTASMVKYFRPLIDWLKNENGNDTGEWLKSGETVESVIDKHFDYFFSDIKYSHN